MGTGIQESGMMARSARTGVELMVKAEDLLAASIAALNHKGGRNDIFTEWIRDGGRLSQSYYVPTEMLPEMLQRCEEQGIPVCVCAFKKEGQEYAKVYTLGGMPYYDENGLLLHDEEGNIKFDEKTLANERALKSITDEFNDLYAQKKDHAKTAYAANLVFGDRETIKLQSLDLGELLELQRCTSAQGIDSFISRQLDDYNYQIEFAADDAKRNDPKKMSPLETALFNAKVGLSVPQNHEYLNELTRSQKTIGNYLMPNRFCDPLYVYKVCDHDYEIVDSADPNDYMEIDPQERVAKVRTYNEESHSHYIVKTIDLKTESGEREFNSVLASYGSNPLVLSEGDLDSYDQDYCFDGEPDTFDWELYKEDHPDFEHGWNNFIKRHPDYLDLSSGFYSFFGAEYDYSLQLTDNFEANRDVTFNAAELIQKEAAEIADPTLRAEKMKEANDLCAIKEDPNNPGYQMLEIRIPESDVVVANVLAKNLEGEIDANELAEAIKENESRLTFDITTPNLYERPEEVREESLEREEVLENGIESPEPEAETYDFNQDNNSYEFDFNHTFGE